MGRSSDSSVPLRAGAFAAFALVAACGAAEMPGWERLEPSVAAAGVREFVTLDGRSFRLESRAEGIWLSTVVERGDWSFDEGLRGGTWFAPLLVAEAGRPPRSGTSQRFEAPGRRFLHDPPTDDPSIPWRLEPGSFAAVDKRLLLKLADGEEPPARAQLSVFTGREAGEASAERAGRILGRRFSGRGVSVWSGESAECVVDVPRGSRLRFATALEPALGSQRDPVSFVVSLDGEVLFEHVARNPFAPASEWHAVELPEVRAGRLSFEVRGAFAYSSFCAPVIGPAECGRYGERPWPGARPDIVVFLADTFRADSMAAYGGELGLTPNLDRFAADALTFRRTWSTGTFTLPAHASLFTGVFPHQVGIVGTNHGVPEALVTIAEHLAAHGYRTGAITDAVVVTSELGLAQGFEWFDELHSAFGSTRNRTAAFLDADDGRPLFLFVQTYRTHLPYSVSPRTREEWGERLDLRGDPDELRLRVQRLLASPPETPDRARSIERTLDALRGHYLGGVVDLDRAFAVFRDELCDRGLDDAWFVFTSDHGEAFGENGAIFHREKVWEVLARVPLAISGPGIEPGVVDHAASLVDLPSTLAEMAGLAPHESWLGRSLLSLDEDRPAFVFECRNYEGSTLAVVEGAHKVIGYEAAERLAAQELLGGYRLDRDPDEHEDALERGEAWPRELFERMQPTLQELVVPLVEGEEARLSAERLRELRAMGYGGD